jgi:hypothetical protein
MTFAACATETVGSPVVPTTDGLWAALTVGAPPFGSLPGVAGALLADGRSAMAELGATSAPDGGTEPTDGEDEGAWVAGLGEAAVDVTTGGDSTFVTG